MLWISEKFVKQICIMLTLTLGLNKKKKKKFFFDLWNVSPEVKDISKTHAAAMNTDRVLRIWHKGLDMIYPLILKFTL